MMSIYSVPFGNFNQRLLAKMTFRRQAQHSYYSSKSSSSLFLYTLAICTLSLLVIVHHTTKLVEAFDTNAVNNNNNQNANKQADNLNLNEQDFEKLGIHYGKYLKNVLAALEKDKNFTKTVSEMGVGDIKSRKIAEQLQHVHEKVRDELHSLKYLEIQRLRELATRQNEINQYGETYHGNDKRKWRTLGASLGANLPSHIGTDNTRFDIDDLQKLIVAATEDLTKLDAERRKDFELYEMEKEYQYQESLKHMNETAKKEAEKLKQDMKQKHEQHTKIHEPGKKKQLEDVWEQKYNLPKNEFNSKTYFALQDKDSNNFWDPEEIKEMLQPDVKKIYDPNNPNDDPNEMDEETERMREHLLSEMDTNHDGLISQKEFMDYTSHPDFNIDHGWEDLSKKQHYTHEQYEQYVKQREEMLRQAHGYYNLDRYAKYPEQFHLPYGMPVGADPSQYYHYQVDPNAAHHQQQILAAQQQQHIAYQQAAYAQQAAVQGQHPAYQPVYQQQASAPYQQQHVQQVPYQQPPVQQNYQQPPALQQQQPAQQMQQPAQQMQQPAQQIQQPQLQQQQQQQQPQLQQPQLQQPQQPQMQQQVPSQIPIQQPMAQQMAQPQQIHQAG